MKTSAFFAGIYVAHLALRGYNKDVAGDRRVAARKYGLCEK
jgi:hypothetical protein